ncbi:hypothetical protein GQ457_05G012890 [Hibiscus cannabinus]
MYLTGKAEIWYDGYIMQKHHLTWHEFTADLCHRFCDKNQWDVIEEFNKLCQSSTVEEYQEKFEELKPLMLQQNSHLPETYFVSSFISGLKEEIRHKVKIHEPTTLADAYRKAQLYELSLEVESRKFKAPLRFNNTFMNNRISTQQSSLQPTLRTASPPRQTLIEYRRNNNLCFRCGDKFHPGQPCKQKHFNLMEEQTDNPEELLQIQDSHSEQEDDKLEISMNALTGSVGYSTIRIQGTIKGNPVSILVDSGSTHSFITPGWAKEGLELVQTSPLIITVANGEKLHSTTKVKQLQWQMQGHSFLHDFRVLKMGGSDIVLGVDWMRTFSPILMDFKEMTLSFNKDGKDITLQGGKKQAYFKIISGEKLQKLATKDPDITGELYFLSAKEVDAETPEPLLPILSEYQDVFEEPKHLPPTRLHDHAIRLQPNTQPINLRPYMYSFQQKTELEKQISDLLASSIIQSSKSPFASPYLLVKKKDGTWRLCIDYRQLNSFTIKDKFPIPIIEDLLDELSAASYYSKLDLRSGYWQIRIREEDIHKTAFRTHSGHYEFKVMPFGLTNAPATFQALMNDIFGPYLRKFVLVFFDDILVYSPSLQEHIHHLQTILQVLRQHHLFARRKKCFFGQPRVEYLGHIISKEGVATNPSKIEAMQNRKTPKSLKSLRGFLGLTGYY